MNEEIRKLEYNKKSDYKIKATEGNEKETTQ